MEEHSWKYLLSRYFLHGILFSLMLLGLSYVWLIVFALLTYIGAFIGVIIGVIVFFFFIGCLNAFLTDKIWSFYVKTDWKSLLAHGFVLSILLIIVSSPSIVINLLIPNLATIIVLFVINTFIEGYVARNIAASWEEEEYQE